jgi:hypothetical protein
MYHRARRRRASRSAAVTLGTALVAAGAAGAWLLARGPGRPALPDSVLLAALSTAVMLLSVAAAVLSWKLGGDVDRWRRGAEGERRTADLLDTLPSRRWGVWHDLRVPGSSANIDHVVVGRTGVWVVDSKSTRATVRARRRSVRFGDRPLDTAATRWEAKAAAGVVAGALGWDPADLTAGRRPVVRPLVAVHGRGLRRRGARMDGVRIVAAGDALDRIRRGRRRLSRRDARRVCVVLEEWAGSGSRGPALGRRAAGAGRR